MAVTDRNDVIELCAVVVEYQAQIVAHAAMSMRNTPCRDRRDEDDYERMAQKFDSQKDVLKKAADAVRALKSTAEVIEDKYKPDLSDKSEGLKS